MTETGQSELVEDFGQAFFVREILNLMTLTARWSFRAESRIVIGLFYN